MADTRDFHETVAEHKKDIARRARWHVAKSCNWCKVGDVIKRSATSQYYLNQEDGDSWVVKKIYTNGNGREKIDMVSCRTGEPHKKARWGFKYESDPFLTAAYCGKPLTSTVESGTSEV